MHPFQRQFTQEELSKMFNRIDRDEDGSVFPKDIIYFMVKKFRLKGSDKPRLKKIINFCLRHESTDFALKTMGPILKAYSESDRRSVDPWQKGDAY